MVTNRDEGSRAGQADGSQRHGTLLVTGGSRGIGRAVALAAGRDGWPVAVGFHRDRTAAASVVATIEGAGGRAASVQGDVADPGQAAGMVADAAELLGPLGGLVTAAGRGYRTRAIELDADTAAHVFAVNVVGLMVGCREAARRLSTARGGPGGGIVTISSFAGATGGRPGASVYGASKSAVDAFTANLAREVGPEGVRVNAVRPGITDTDMVAATTGEHDRRAAIEHSIPMGRIGHPAEVAAAVVWLLSDEASWVTGAHLDVHGGGFVIGT